MQDKQPSVKRNFIMNALLTMSSMIFPLITFRYVSQILLPEGTGRVSFAIALIGYFNMIAQLGIPTYGIRACATVRDDRKELSRTAQELLIINLVMSAAAYAALAVALWVIPELRQDKLLYLVVSATILLTTVGMEWLYKALEQYTYITLRSLIFKVIALAAMLLLIQSREDYVLYGAITVLASSGAYAVNLFQARRYIDLRPVGNWRFRRHLKAVMIFFAMSCATTVYTNLDTVMLGFLKTQTDVGYYDAAVKVKGILVAVVTSLGAVLLPRASYYIETDQKEAFWKISKNALHFVFLAALPLMLFFILFAKPSIFFLTGGDAYANAVLPMQTVMPTLLFIGLTNILGIQILVPLGREKVVLWSVIAGAAVDFVLNFLVFIPLWGAAGAALGTLCAEAAVLLVQLKALWSQVGGMLRSVPYGKLLAALAAGAVLAWPVGLLQLGNFWCLLLGAVLFFGAYVLTLLLLREPLLFSTAQELMKKIKGKASN